MNGEDKLEKESLNDFKIAKTVNDLWRKQTFTLHLHTLV